MYLRARYYDPSISRFIQIDNNYAGEQEQVNTQNRYSYTINNPYKYVDRDGNRAIQMVGNIVKTVQTTTAIPKLFNQESIIAQAKKKLENQSKFKVKSWVKNLFGVFAKIPMFNKMMNTILKIIDMIPDIVVEAIVVGTGKNKPTPKEGCGHDHSNLNYNTDCPDSKKKNEEIVWWKSFENVVEAFQNIFDIKAGCKLFLEILQSGFRKTTSFREFVGKLVKSGLNLNSTINVGGRRTAVKEVLDVATGSNTGYKKVIYKMFAKTLNGNSFFKYFIKISGLDLGMLFFESLVLKVDAFTVLCKGIANVLYNFLKRAGAVLFKIILLPFIGPFSWLFGVGVEVAFWLADLWWNLTDTLTEFVRWVFTQGNSFVNSFVNVLGGDSRVK